jgi:hypothetical protein
MFGGTWGASARHGAITKAKAATKRRIRVGFADMGNGRQD